MTSPDVDVHELALSGEGVGRDPDGRVWFVPRTAPGDRVAVHPVRVKRRWARGRVARVELASPDRVEPPCPHFEACGGCDFQHVRHELQATAWEQGLRSALIRVGGVADPPVEPLVDGGSRLGYRNRITLHLRRTPGGAVAGYHSLEDPGRLTAIDNCLLAERPIQEAWAGLRAGWGESASALPAGAELRITLRSAFDGRIALVVQTSRSAPEDEEQPGDPEWVARLVPRLDSYWWIPATGARVHLAGQEHFRDRWGDFDLELRPNAFLQVNREVARGIEAHLDGLAGRLEGQRVLDLYAGVGLRALRWARAGARVVACDREPDAVATGRAAAARYGLDLDFVSSRVEQVLSAMLPANLAVVNPPRGGLDPVVVEALRVGGLDALAYVSCDPATLARDVARLKSVWTLRSARPFAAFPQTGHVETVAWLEPTPGRAAA